MTIKDDYSASAAGAGSITIGAIATGTIETPGDVDWFKVDLAGLSTYRFNIRGADADGGTLAWNTASRDVHLRLWDPAGQQYLYPLGYDSGTGAPVLSFAIKSAGTYYLEVAGGQGTGTYSVSSLLIDKDDYAGDAAHATSVALGTAVSGQLSYAGDNDAFSVPVTEGKSYQVTLTAGADLNATTYVTVADSAQWQQDGDIYAPGSTITVPFVAHATGAATVTLSNLSGSGGYTWKVDEVADDFKSGTGTQGTIVAGASVTGAFETTADLDWFGVDLQADLTYLIRLKGPGDSYYPLVNIRDANGTQLSTPFDWHRLSDGACVVWKPTASGHYFIETGSDITGNYTLSVQPPAPDDHGQTMATAGQLTPGTPLIGHTEVPGDVDWYSFTVEAGNGYVLHAEANPDMGLRGGLGGGIYDASGVGVAAEYQRTDQGWDVLYQPSTTTTYYVAVAPYNSLGSYTLSLSAPISDAIPGDRTTTASILPGAVLRSTLDFKGDVDYVSAQVQAGHEYRFQLLGAADKQGALGSPVADLSGQHGEWERGWTSYGHANELVVRPTVDGTVWLAIRDQNGATGTYTLLAQSDTVAYADLYPPQQAFPTLPTRAPSADTALDRHLFLTYAEDVNVAGTIQLLDGHGSVLQTFGAGDAAVSIVHGTVSLASSVADGTSYVLQAATGAVTDLAGNPAPAFSFAFSTPEANRIQDGTAGNDTFAAGTGTDRFDGGAGLDTVVYDGTRSSYGIFLGKQSVKVAQYEGAASVDQLLGIERIVFHDSVVACDIDGSAGQTYRLYQAAFNRTPDGAGLAYWIKQHDQGMSLHDVADAFMHSQEFVDLYGSAPQPAALATAIYHSVMHREPDQAGFDYWVSALEHGMAPADVLVSFSECLENQANVIGQIKYGIVLPL